MNKNKFSVSFGTFFLVASIATNFVACSNGESGNNASSAEPEWVASYPIIIDQSQETIYVQYVINDGLCRIDKYSASWESYSFELPFSMKYKVSNNQLSILVEGNDEVNSTVYEGENGGSLFGIWKFAADGSAIKLTADTLYTTDEPEGLFSGSTPSEVVESPIDLASSYFIYDLYSCSTGASPCSFSHWHLTKDTPEPLDKMIQENGIQILESSERHQSLIIKGKNVFVDVEHVQLDSLNEGNSLISASIKTAEESCHFIHSSSETTEELCVTANLDFISKYVMEDDDGSIYSLKAVKDNSTDFSDCVKNLLK